RCLSRPKRDSFPLRSIDCSLVGGSLKRHGEARKGKPVDNFRHESIDLARSGGERPPQVEGVSVPARGSRQTRRQHLVLRAGFWPQERERPQNTVATCVVFILARGE